MQLLTKAWTAGLLNALGDGVAQKFVEKNDSMDLKRLGIFAFLVSVLVGYCTANGIASWSYLKSLSGLLLQQHQP